MRGRQRENSGKTVQAELWAKGKLAATPHEWSTQAMWGCRLFDFWCHRLGIAVEIDGATHDQGYDAARDRYNYYRSGIVVLRVRNYDEAAMQQALDLIASADDWQTRKAKMREQFGLTADEPFRNVLKKVNLRKAHGNWKPIS